MDNGNLFQQYYAVAISIDDRYAIHLWWADNAEDAKAQTYEILPTAEVLAVRKVAD